MVMEMKEMVAVDMGPRISLLINDMDRWLMSVECSWSMVVIGIALLNCFWKQ